MRHPPLWPEGAASRSRTQHLGLKSRNTKKRRRPRTGGGPRHVGRFTLTLAVRTYPSLRPACFRSAYAADNPIAIRHRIASERDGRPGSPLRHSSMSCCHSRSSRKLTTGVCPIRGRPRFFRITTFESVMRRVLQQSSHTGNPVERADIVRSEIRGVSRISRHETGAVRQVQARDRGPLPP